MVTNILRKRHFCGFLKLTVVNNFFWIEKMQTVLQDYFACLFPLIFFPPMQMPASAITQTNRKLGTNVPAFGGES